MKRYGEVTRRYRPRPRPQEPHPPLTLLTLTPTSDLSQHSRGRRSVLPQGLCTRCALCLECFPHEPSHGSSHSSLSSEVTLDRHFPVTLSEMLFPYLLPGFSLFFQNI